MKSLISASVLALALTGAGAAQADYVYTMNFDSLKAGDNANLDPTAIANGVHFASGQLAADLDQDGLPIYDPFGNFVAGATHYEAIPGLALTVDSPSAYGHGQTSSNPLALNALYDQVLINFAAPVKMTGFSFTLDNSSYGDLFPTAVEFLDAKGKTLFLSQSFTGAGTTTFSAQFAPTEIAAVLLPSTTKFYDDITVSAVPEPTSLSMLLGGLALLGVAARRRSN